ncbi:hypothetical protein P7C70_g5360, partial [Phenoliferia sp. Uapishka_3]
MCYARTSVFYGLSIRAKSLVVAAKAHRDLRGPTLALGLIELRVQTGVIKTVDGNGAQKIPAEVWRLVRREFYLDALCEAQDDWTGTMRCKGNACRWADQFEKTRDWDGTFSWKDGWQNGCTDCKLAYGRRISVKDMGAGKLVEELLATFGFILPLGFHCEGLQPGETTWHWEEYVKNPERSWAISLPLLRTHPTAESEDNGNADKSEHFIEAQSSEESGGEASTIVPITSEWVVPSGSLRRFPRFIELYDLESGDVASQMLKGDGEVCTSDLKGPQWRLGTVVMCGGKD